MTMGDVLAVSSAAPIFSAEIPGLPPSLWAAYHKGQVLTRIAREWREMAVWHLRSRKVTFANEVLSVGRYFALLELIAPVRGKWDVDNREKLVFDALTLANIWPDDSRMDGHTTVFRRGKVDTTCVTLWRFGAGGVRE